MNRNVRRSRSRTIPAALALNIAAESGSTSLNPGAFPSLLEGLTNESAELPARTRNQGLCLLSGFFTPFSASTPRALYPTHASYVSKYTAAASQDLAAGFLTPETYAEAVAQAQASSIP